MLYEIIPIVWPTALWGCTNGDDYSTLEWISTDIPKPTEAEIRAHSDDVDAIILERRRLSRIEGDLMGGYGGEVYWVMKSIFDFLNDVATKPQSEWDTTLLMQQRQRFVDIEARYPPGWTDPFF